MQDVAIGNHFPCQVMLPRVPIGPKINSLDYRPFSQGYREGLGGNGMGETH